MNETKHMILQTRRRFLTMLVVLGAMLAWPVRRSSRSRLSRHEASFYRKRRHDNT
jgi:uncharacterized membrane protein